MYYEIYNYSYVFEFERSWNETAFKNYCERRWTDSCLCSVVYLMVIFALKRLMKHHSPFDLRKPLTVWSVTLALFSIFGTIRSLPELVMGWIRNGFQFTVCIPAYAGHVPGFWGSIFTISKVIELGDTVFIVLRKKPLVFLHWYHHVTVLILVFHTHGEHGAAGRWYYAMNYFVHSVMYTYYALRAMQIYVPKQVNLAITTMQLCQMVMGCFINIMVYYYKSRGDFCQQTYSNLIFATFIYTSYFFLFANFFYKTYILRKVKAH